MSRSVVGFDLHRMEQVPEWCQLLNTGFNAGVEIFADFVQGLRTLVLATKSLEEEEWEEWDARYQEAAADLSDRDDKVLSSIIASSPLFHPFHPSTPPSPPPFPSSLLEYPHDPFPPPSPPPGHINQRIQ